MSQSFTTLAFSGITSPDWQLNELSVKAEAEQLYIEAESWLMVDVNFDNDSDEEDTSQDWSIRPVDVVDPNLQRQWKKDRLWMMDPTDGMLGDDAMPALCGGCDGVFWGDEMISIRKTIDKLRNKHGKSINGLGNVWEEVESSIVEKLRANRMCKKCYKVSVEARANPWNSTSSYASNPPAQQHLPFPQIGSIAQPLSNNNVCTASGMAPPSGRWEVSYTFGDTDDGL